MIQEQALAAGDDADVILDRAESAIFQLAEDRVKAGLIGVKDLVKDGFERLEKIFSEGRRITGLATGYAGSRQRNRRTAALRADYSGGAAFDGENGAGAEHRGKCGAAAARAGGDLQPGNVEGVAAAALAGVARRAWTRTNSAPAT